MALIQTWVPPSREHWQLIQFIWQFFPVFALIQWLTAWYPMGKTSVDSRFNLPGRIGWVLMEAPGTINLLYIMFTLPRQNGVESLPAGNWLMAGLFTTHYIYRALLSPLILNPSMSPIHIAVALMALCFQLVNSTCIGGWLASYGPLTAVDWAGQKLWIELGLMVFALGFLGNIYHDDELREIRRAAARNQERKQADQQDQKKKTTVDKVYMLPENGLFRLILYPHFLCEWVEWAGFWMIGGLGCVPARAFLINEIASMLPRAIRGKAWYIDRFGKEKVGRRKAIIPGII